MNFNENSKEIVGKILDSCEMLPIEPREHSVSKPVKEQSDIGLLVQKELSLNRNIV